jgi:hypothetical protein
LDKFSTMTIGTVRAYCKSWLFLTIVYCIRRTETTVELVDQLFDPGIAGEFRSRQSPRRLTPRHKEATSIASCIALQTSG